LSVHIRYSYMQLGCGQAVLVWFGISPMIKCYVLAESARYKLTETQEEAIIFTNNLVQVNK